MEDDRFCEHCNQYHGILYLCEHYSEKVKKEIEKDIIEWKAKIYSKEYESEQLEKGVPKEVLEIMKIFTSN